MSAYKLYIFCQLQVLIMKSKKSIVCENRKGWMDAKMNKNMLGISVLFLKNLKVFKIVHPGNIFSFGDFSSHFCFNLVTLSNSTSGRIIFSSFRHTYLPPFSCFVRYKKKNRVK